jgi:CHASE2 domain-containing sensor protein/predicted Ser/Thr protein kinase
MFKKFSGFILYVLITILVISLYAGKYGFLESLDLRMQDGMFKLRGSLDPQRDIVIVGIDEKSLDQMGEWPWSQDKLAQLISAISRGSPRVLALDIFLPESLDEDTSGRTELLANEIHLAGNVILPIYFNLSEVGMAPTPPPPAVLRSAWGKANGFYPKNAASAKQLYFPDKLLTQSAFDFGHINITYDPDGLIRRELTLIEYDGYLYSSLSLQTAKRYLGKDKKETGLTKEGRINLGGISIPTDKKRYMVINYRGPNLTFQRVSALDVLNGETSPKVFSDKIALVGLTALQSKTWVKVPSYGTLNEVERIANVIQNIIQHNFLSRLSPMWNLLILILIGIFCALVLPKVSLAYRIVVLLVLLFVMFNLNYILFSSFAILTKPFYPILEILFFLVAAPSVKAKRAGEKEDRIKDLGVEESYAEDKIKEDHEIPEGQKEQFGEEVPISRHRICAKTVSEISGFEKSEPVSLGPEGQSTSLKITTEEKRKKEETIALSTSSTPSAIQKVTGSISEPTPERISGEESSRKEALTVSDLTAPRSSQEITGSLSEKTPKGTSEKSTDHLPLAQFGRYKIQELIGKGGMGTVYKGLDPALDRLVALKTIRLDFASSAEEISELKERLVREAKAAGKLSHPNIVTIYDVGEQEGLQYIAMEYLSGYTLESFIQKKKELNYRIVAKIVMQVCAALNYAHQKGIVHRDIKPANIMLLEDFAVKVMDFGIARLQSSSLTQSNLTLGTPHYISPEQLQGKLADKRSDIFSLGVVIYELLTGQKPFKGESISSLMYDILSNTPPLPSTLNEKTPLVFDRIVSKAMAKSPEERYQEAEEIEKTLREFISSFVVTHSIRV